MCQALCHILEIICFPYTNAMSWKGSDLLICLGDLYAKWVDVWKL